MPRFGHFVILVEILAKGADVQEKDRRLHPRHVLLGDDGLFDGVHAAHSGAIIPPAGRVAGANALQPGDALWLLAIRRTLHVPAKRPGGRQDTLELDAGHHVGIVAVAVFALEPGVEGLHAWGQDDSAHVQLADLVHHIVDHGLGLARIETLQALRADAAGETAFRLSQGLFLGQAQAHLAEVVDALRNRQVSLLHARLIHYITPLQSLLNLLLAQLDFGLQDRLPCAQFLAAQVAVNGTGGLMPGGDGLHHEGRPRHRIPAGEHPGLARGQRIRIHLDGPPPRYFDVAIPG